ncbi:MAG: hypothetical protein ACQBVK_01145 [Candidatus Phytoplasma sp. TWB_XP]
MSNYSSEEQKFETEVFEKLKLLGYEPVEINSLKDLEPNFKKQFVKYNLEFKVDPNFKDPNQLKDNWFDTTISKYINRVDVLKSYHLLRDKPSIPSKQPRKSFSLGFFNKVDWCKNLFQVARQVKIKDEEKLTQKIIVMI